MRAYKLAVAFILIACLSCIAEKESLPLSNPQDRLNALTEEEKEEGWILLFDGKSFSGWRSLGRDRIPEDHWIIQDEAIKKVPSGDIPLQEDGQPLEGGDIITIRTFENFELTLEWMISPAGNSGIKYNVSEKMSTSYSPEHAALGFEYQILDDDEHPDAKAGTNRTAAALYDMIAPREKKLNPVGEYNTARIIFNGNHGEHWLNGIKVLEYDLDTPRMESLLAASKYRIYPDFAKKRKGHIVLQDHADTAWYRNIKIRELKPN
jgi:hypothetical protein